MKIAPALWTLLWLVPIPLRIAAQDRPALTGTVLDTAGAPVAGAEVRVLGTSAADRTDERGEFRLVDVAPGEHLIEARRVGYDSRTVVVIVDADGRGQVAIRLTPRAAVLPTVEVAGEAWSGPPAFERRRRAKGSGGVFMTREQIERIGGSQLSQLFRRVPGVRVMENRIGRHHIVMTRSLGLRGCPPVIYLDGAPIQIDPHQGIDFLDPSSVEALEVYRGPSEVPPELNTTESACGVVVIWTRRPSD